MQQPDFITDLDPKPLLSTLWLFVVLNILFKDIHELFRPGMLAEMMTGTVNGVTITEPMMLQAAFMVELLLLMVPLARVLPFPANRWLNLVIAPVTLVITLTSGPFDLDNIFFAAVVSVTLLLILAIAWRWRAPSTQRSGASAATTQLPQEGSA